MLDLHQIVQTQIKGILQADYIDWQLYALSEAVTADFANLKQTPQYVCDFRATKPRAPSQLQQSNPDGTQILDMSVYLISILEVPREITKAHVMKIKNAAQYYAPLSAISEDLVGRTVSGFQIKLFE